MKQVRQPIVLNPPPAALRSLRYMRNRWLYRGRDRYCPICESHSSRFLPMGP